MPFSMKGSRMDRAWSRGPRPGMEDRVDGGSGRGMRGNAPTIMEEEVGGTGAEGRYVILTSLPVTSRLSTSCPMYFTKTRKESWAEKRKREKERRRERQSRD